MPATYEPISTTTLGSAASSITFSSIPGTYTDLRLVLVCTSNSGFVNTRLRFNSDSGSNYSMTEINGTGSSANSNRNTSETYMFLPSGFVGTTEPMLDTIDIFSYAGSTNKTILYSRSADRNGAGSVVAGVGLWRSTSAITSIDLYADTSGNWAANTTATLYGILKAA